MKAAVPDVLLAEFAALVAERLGLEFLPQRRSELLRGLDRVARDFGFEGAEPCVRWLADSPPSRPQVEVLAAHLTVGETYFFREPAVFEALERDVLPPLLAARERADKRLRIWCAGCCTGEEVYSLAIVLARMIPDLGDWDVTILGTDINPAFLAKAESGLYKEWSFRGTPSFFKRRHFHTDEGGHHLILPQLRRHVRFAQLNLMDDVYPCAANGTSEVDLVLCRNVLMYFGAAAARRVIERLHRALLPGGWLVVGAAETSQALFPEFTPVSLPGAAFYRKGASLPPVPAVTPGLEFEDGDAAHSWCATRPPPARTSPCEAGPDPSPGALASSPGPHARATAAFEQGAYEEVVKLLSPEHPGDARDLALLARACANLGRLDEARRWCEAAVEAAPLDARLRYLAASVLQEQARLEEAAATLRQALYLDPRHVLAHFALGSLDRRRGRRREAARHFANAAHLLREQPADAQLPDAEGLTAGDLLVLVRAAEGGA